MGTFGTKARTKSCRGPSYPFSAFVGAKADRLGYTATVAPCRDNRKTALAAAFGLGLDIGPGQKNHVFLALTIGALAFERAAAETLAFEVLAAVSADDFEALGGPWHWLAVTPAVKNLGSNRCVASVIPGLTAV